MLPSGAIGKQPDGARRPKGLSRICARGMTLKAQLKYTKVVLYTSGPPSSDFEVINNMGKETYCIQGVSGLLICKYAWVIKFLQKCWN